MDLKKLSDNIQKKLRELLDKGSLSMSKAPVSQINASINQKLYNDLQECFKNKLKTLSVGRRMLYPMYFTILMHQSDYEEVRESLGYVLAEVVRMFYDIIRENKEIYSNYTPPAKDWFFNISGSRLSRIPLSEGKFVEVHKGEFTPITHLYAPDFESKDNVRVESNLRVSLKVNNSDVFSDVNLNPEVLKEFHPLAEGVFKFSFKESLPEDAAEILDNSNVTEIGGLAELSYSSGNENRYFLMKDSLVHISGKNEMREGRSFFKVDSENIKDSHVQIKYIPDEKKFQLAAYGPVRLNARKVNESSGGNILWYDLANHSTIFINNEISVKFRIK